MNYNYHIHKSNIQCPYCDKICADDDYVVSQNMEEKIKFECENCGRMFWIEACVVYNSYSDCELNDKEHDFINDCEKHPTVFNCKNCYQTKVVTTDPTPKDCLKEKKEVT